MHIFRLLSNALDSLGGLGVNLGDEHQVRVCGRTSSRTAFLDLTPFLARTGISSFACSQ